MFHLPARKDHEVPANADRGRSTIRASVRAGRFEASLDADIAPAGLLAVGALVSAILLSVVPIIVASTRKLPPR